MELILNTEKIQVPIQYVFSTFLIDYINIPKILNILENDPIMKFDPSKLDLSREDLMRLCKYFFKSR